MSPLDDELRATLRSRADVLAPSPDPLAGIETRARGMRRRRTLASVAGAALAVTAIAVAVPSVLPSDSAAPSRLGTPPPSASPTAAAPEPTSAPPTNLLRWPARGSAPSTLSIQAKQALAPLMDATPDQVVLNVLFEGSDSGLRFVVGQAWKSGFPEARSFGYGEGGTGGPEPFLGPMTDPSTAAVVVPLHHVPGTGRELLVVVPVPGTGQVSYDADSAGRFAPVSGQDQLDGVVVIDRTPGDTGDRLEIVNGDGDLDHPTYRGSALGLACGRQQCS